LEEEIELIVEPRDEFLDIAAFLVALRVIGCGLGKALEMAKEEGYTSTAYIVRKHYTKLFKRDILSYLDGMICIGNTGIEVVERCGGDVLCVRNMLAILLDGGRHRKNTTL
jgi:hypothetical protein